MLMPYFRSEPSLMRPLSPEHSLTWARHMVTRKARNTRWFPSPTQLPTAGQWWSNRRTQRLQICEGIGTGQGRMG